MTINNTELESIKGILEVIEDVVGDAALTKESKDKIKAFKRAVKSLEGKRAKHNECMRKCMINKRAKERVKKACKE